MRTCSLLKMAAWNVKIMEEFVNSPWVDLLSSPHFSTLEKAEVTNIKDAALKTETESSSMKLHKEDMILYGLCPAQDEFFLTICERCNLLVKPQALKTHISVRHKSVETGTLSNYASHLVKQNATNSTDNIFKKPGDYKGSKSQPSTPCKYRTRKSRNSNTTNPSNDMLNDDVTANNEKINKNGAKLKSVKSFPSFQASCSSRTKQSYISSALDDRRDLSKKDKSRSLCKGNTSITNKLENNDNAADNDLIADITSSTSSEISSLHSHDVLSAVDEYSKSPDDKNNDDEFSDSVSDLLMPPKLEPENIFMSDDIIDDETAILDSYAESVHSADDGNNSNNISVSDQHQPIVSTNLSACGPSIKSYSINSTNNTSNNHSDKNINKRKNIAFSTSNKIDNPSAFSSNYLPVQNRVMYIQSNLMNLKPGLHLKSVITSQSQSSLPSLLSSSSSTATTSSSVKIVNSINFSSSLTSPIIALSSLSSSSLCPSSSSILLVSNHQPVTHSITLMTSSSTSSPPPSSLSSLLKSTFVVKNLNTGQVVQKKTAKRRPTNPDFALCKNRQYDPDKHCGVLINETQKPCTRFITCKAHPLMMRRAVKGRSKPFDELMKEQKERKAAAAATYNNINNIGAFSNDIQAVPEKVVTKLNSQSTKASTGKKVKKVPTLPTSESLERLAALLGINSSLSRTSLAPPKSANEQHSSSTALLLSTHPIIKDNLNNASTPILSSSTSCNVIQDAPEKLVSSFVLSSLSSQKPSFWLHQPSSSPSIKTFTTKQTHKFPSILCKSLPAYSSLSSLSSPAKAIQTASSLLPTAHDDPSPCVSSSLATADSDMPTLVPADKIECDIIDEQDFHLKQLYNELYNEQQSHKQQQQQQGNEKKGEDFWNSDNDSSAIINKRHLSSRLMFVPIFNGKRRRPIFNLCTPASKKFHLHRNNANHGPGDDVDDEFDGIDDEEKKGEDEEEEDADEEVEEENDGCPSPAKKLKTTFRQKHPKPITVNGLNSWLYGTGYFSTNRRSDSVRAAVLSIFKQTAPNNFPSPLSPAKAKNLKLSKDRLLTSAYGNALHLHFNQHPFSRSEATPKLGMQKTVYTELKHFSSSSPSHFSNHHLPLCEMPCLKAASKPNHYSLPPNVALVRTNQSSSLSSQQNINVFLDHDTAISDKSLTALQQLSTTTLQPSTTLATTSQATLVAGSLNEPNEQKLSNFNHASKSVSSDSNVQFILSFSNLKHSLDASTELFATRNKLLQASSSLSSSSPTIPKILSNSTAQTPLKAGTFLNYNISNVATPNKKNNPIAILVQQSSTSTSQSANSDNIINDNSINNNININNTACFLFNTQSTSPSDCSTINNLPNNSVSLSNNIINFNKNNNSIINISNISVSGNGTKTFNAVTLNAKATDTSPQLLPTTHQNGHIIGHSSYDNIISSKSSKIINVSNNVIHNSHKRSSSILLASKNKWARVDSFVSSSSSSSSSSSTSSSASASQSIKSYNLANPPATMKSSTQQQVVFSNSDVIYHPSHSSSAPVTSAAASLFLVAPTPSRHDQSLVSSIFLINNKRLSLTSAAHLIHSPPNNLSTIVSAQQQPLLSSSPSSSSSLSSSSSSSSAMPLASNFLLWNANKKVQQPQTVITVASQPKAQRLQLINTHTNNNATSALLTSSTTTKTSNSMTLIKLNNSSSLTASTFFSNPVFKTEVKGRLNGSATVHGQIMLGSRQLISPSQSPTTLKNQMLLKELLGSDN